MIRYYSRGFALTVSSVSDGKESVCGLCRKFLQYLNGCGVPHRPSQDSGQCSANSAARGSGIEWQASSLGRGVMHSVALGTILA